MIIIGAICFSNLVDIKSAPVLDFGFNESQIFRISVSEIFEKLKSLSFLFGKNVLKQTFVVGMSAASCGPICEKKCIKTIGNV